MAPAHSADPYVEVGEQGVHWFDLVQIAARRLAHRIETRTIRLILTSCQAVDDDQVETESSNDFVTKRNRLGEVKAGVEKRHRGVWRNLGQEMQQRKAVRLEGRADDYALVLAPIRRQLLLDWLEEWCECLHSSKRME